MNTMTATPIDKLAWVYVRNKTILSTKSKKNDTYYIPGGKREKGEADIEALTREIKEELSVDLVPETIRYMGQFEAQAHGKAEGVIVRMTCYTAGFRGELKPDSEIEEASWLRYQDRDKSSPVDQIIFEWLHQQGMID